MKRLRIHYLQHVPHEELGCIEEWVSISGHTLTSTKYFEDSKLPKINEIDWLIIMGGPMSVHDEDRFPWLAEEKKFIRQVIDARKTVLGICLGSQLVSTALGARVYKNKEKEIGWFDIELTPFARAGNLFFEMGDRLKVLHWHEDTFDIPEYAVLLASSAGCKNQAFIYKNKVLALQFHLELTGKYLQEWVESGKNELKSGKYVQSEKELLEHKHLIEPNRNIMFRLLARLAEEEKS